MCISIKLVSHAQLPRGTRILSCHRRWRFAGRSWDLGCTVCVRVLHIWRKNRWWELAQDSTSEIFAQSWKKQRVHHVHIRTYRLFYLDPKIFRIFSCTNSTTTIRIQPPNHRRLTRTTTTTNMTAILDAFFVIRTNLVGWSICKSFSA